MTTNILLALGLLSCFGFGGMVMVSQEEKMIEGSVMVDVVEASDFDEIDNVLEDCSVILPEGEIPTGIAYEYILDENGNYVMVDGSGVEVSEFDEIYDYDGSIKEGDKLPVFPVGTAKGAVTWGGATTRGVK